MEDIPEKNDNELGIPTGMTDTAAVSVTIIEDSEVELVKEWVVKNQPSFSQVLQYTPRTYKTKFINLSTQFNKK